LIYCVPRGWNEQGNSKNWFMANCVIIDDAYHRLVSRVWDKGTCLIGKQKSWLKIKHWENKKTSHIGTGKQMKVVLPVPPVQTKKQKLYVVGSIMRLLVHGSGEWIGWMTHRIQNIQHLGRGLENSKNSLLK